MAAASGWYPDPDGTPGRYRYWDGQQWSPETVTDPRAPAPGQGPGQQRSRRTPLLLGLLALLVVIVLLGVVAVRSLLGQSSAVDDPNPPHSSVSGWDDSSPLPTAGPSAGSDRTPDSTRPSSVPCANGSPLRHAEHPNDGRIHGGRLSIEQPGGDWVADDEYASGLQFAYDVSGAREQVESQWWAMVAVGELHTADGFHTPDQSADGVMQCLASSFYYSYFTGRTDLFSKKITVDQRTGWALRSEIRVDDPRVKATGDVVEVIVLPTGDSGKLSLFAGFVPIDDQQRLALLDRVIADLRVT